jgi:long-chain fatty acid transport protein
VGAHQSISKTLSGNRVSGEFDNTWIEALTAHMTWHY